MADVQDNGMNLETVEKFTKDGHDFMKNGDINNSYSSYAKAVEFAEQNGESFTLRSCLFNFGACCITKGDISQGLEYLLRSIPLNEECDGTVNYADVHYNIAIAYDILGKKEEAISYYEICLKIYENNENLEMQGEVLLKLAGAYITLNMLNKSCGMFQIAEQVFEKLLDDRHQLLCISSRATLLAEMKNVKCYELVQNIVDKVEKINNDLLKAKICSDIGLVFTSSGNFDDAILHLTKALNLIQTTGEKDKKLQACVCQNLGAIHNQLGSFVNATIYHEKAIQLYGELGQRYSQGHSFSNLAFAYGQLGNFEKCQEHFKHALQAAKDCHDYRGQWQAYEALSAVYFQRKDYDKAVDSLKLCLTIVTFNGQVKDELIHKRIVGKLSSALEYQLRGKNQVDIIHNSNDYINTSSKVGQTRSREKNHKFVARGLDLHETLSEGDLDSTFDSITSYSGEMSDDAIPKLSSDVVKKDILNNTYEEPVDILNILNTNNDEQQQTTQGKTVKSKLCIIQ